VKLEDLILTGVVVLLGEEEKDWFYHCGGYDEEYWQVKLWLKKN